MIRNILSNINIILLIIIIIIIIIGYECSKKKNYELFGLNEYNPITWSISINPKIGSNFKSIATDKTGKFLAGCIEADGIYTSSDSGKSWVKTSATLNKWQSICSNDSGQILYACAYDESNPTNSINKIFKSTNGGLSWTNKISPTNSNTIIKFLSITTDATGKYVAACAHELGIYSSINYGVSWNLSRSVKNWYYIKSSSTGQYLVATEYYGKIYTSSDYGRSWAVIPVIPDFPDPDGIWISASINETGTFIIAAHFTKGMYIFKKSDSTWTWTQKLSNNSIKSFTSNMTCQYSIATTNEGIYISSNYGSNWILSYEIAGVDMDYAVSSTYSGNQIIAANRDDDKIYIGINNFSQLPPQPTSISTSNITNLITWNSMSKQQIHNIKGIVTDKTGRYLAVCVDGGRIYTSFNSGNSWEITPAPRKEWKSITCNESGTILFACAFNDGIYKSSNSGKTWDITLAPSPNKWISITSDKTCQFITACIDDGGIYTSINNGTSWNLSTAPNGLWRCIKSSSTGQYLVACVYNGNIYSSSNYGTLWNVTLAPTRSWVSVSINDIGTVIIAADDQQRIYIYSNSIWTPNLFNTGFNSVTSDTTGQYLIAGTDRDSAGTNKGLYMSFNYGSDWTLSYPLDNIEYVVSSTYSGNKIIAAGTLNGKIYIGINNLITQPLPIIEPTDPPVTNIVNPITWKSIVGLKFKGIATDKTGQKLIGCEESGSLYWSSNYGNTWGKTSIIWRYWKGITSNESGKILFACASREIFKYSSGSKIWKETSAPSSDWSSITSDKTCKYIAACIDNLGLYTSNKGIYTSIDSGNSWKPSNAPNDQWRCIKSSSTGQYLVACVYGDKIYTSSDYGVTWTPTLAPRGSWVSVSINDTGTIIIAADRVQGIYIYSNSNWTPKLLNIGFNSVTSDTTGQYLIAGSSKGLYISSNYGLDWILSYSSENVEYVVVSTYSGNQIFAVGTNNGNIYIGINNLIRQELEKTISPQNPITWKSTIRSNFIGIATNKTGQKLVGCENSGKIYTSSNYGNSWEITFEPTISDIKNWTSITSDESGQNLFICEYNDGIYKSDDFSQTWNNTSGIYKSNDFGKTWNITSAPSSNWTSITCDKTGKYIAACVDNLGIYTSSDSGIEWTLSIVVNDQWNCIKSSSTGQYLVACIYGDKIYTSSDYGVTWTPTLAPKSSWTSVSINDTGTIIIAANYNQGIYLYSNSNWTQKLSNIGFNSVTSDTTGQYLVAGSNKNLYISSNYGLDWILSHSSENVEYVLSSTYSGNQIIAAGTNNNTIYIGTNNLISQTLTTTPPYTTPPYTTPPYTTPPYTTQPPIYTSQPPITTSQPPIYTSQPPITTSRPPIYTSQPPITTSQPPIYTSRPPITTSRPPIYTSQPPITTSQPPIYTSQPPIYTTSQPPIYTSRPPIYTSQPPITTSRVNTTLSIGFVIDKNDRIFYADNNIESGEIIWKILGPYKIINISISDGKLYGITSDNKIYYYPDYKTTTNRSLMSNNWVPVSSNLVQINFDYYNKIVIIIDSGNNIYYADTNIETNPNWTLLPGSLKLKNISLSYGIIYGIDSNNNIYYIPNYKTGIGIPIPFNIAGGLTRISVDYYNKIIIGINGPNIYYADSNIESSPNWTQLPNPSVNVNIVDISISSGKIYCVTESFVYYASNYKTAYWVPLPLLNNIKQISLDFKITPPNITLKPINITTSFMTPIIKSDFPSNDNKIIPLSNLESSDNNINYCARLCNLTTGCNGFVYKNDDFKCYLKNNMKSKIDNNNSTSYIRNIPNYNLFSKDINYYSNIKFTDGYKFQNSNPQECAQKCTDATNPVCNYFYINTINNDCYLKHNIDESKKYPTQTGILNFKVNNFRLK